MKKITRPLLIVFFCGAVTISNAQDPETTTYFGEKNGFQLDIPNSWNAALKETKGFMGMSTTAIVALKADMPWAVITILTKYGCKSHKSEMKGFVSIFEKDAKKSKDSNFKINEQGESENAEGKGFSFIDYTYTFVAEDGSRNLTRRKFYTVCDTYKGNKYAYQYFFNSLETDWDKVKDTYDQVFKSVKYK